MLPGADSIPLNKKVILDTIELLRQEENNALPQAGAAPARPPSRRLLAFIAGLSALDRAQVAAVMLIGRQDEEPEDFDNVVKDWNCPLDSTQPEYLVGKKHLRRFLEAGLARLTDE